MARTKAAKMKAAKTKASRLTSTSGCSACRERRLNCDETLPTCQRCRDDGRECEGSWGRISASSETLPPSNTSPTRNIRAIAVNAESFLSAVETPPSDVSAPISRSQEDLTCEKDTVSNSGEVEPGASQTHDVTGVEERPLTTESELLEKQEKILQDSQIVRPVAPGTDPCQALALGGLEQAGQSTTCAESENSKKRTASVVSLATMNECKRARGDKVNQRTRKWIAVSFGPAGIQYKPTSESESLPAAEALRRASPADSLDTQSSDGCEAVREAQMALSVANEEPADLIPFSRAERSTESGNHQCNSHPASPADISPCSSQERSNVRVPSNIRHSTASPPVEMEDSGKPRNAQWPGNCSSASAGQRKLHPLLPRPLPTMEQRLPASADGLSPTLNGSHHQGTCKNGSPSSLEAKAGLNSYQAAPHQQAGLQPISRGGGHSSVNHNHREPSATIAKTWNSTRRGLGSGSQIRLQEQRPHESSPTLPLQPLSLHVTAAVRFTAGNHTESTLSEAAIQPYLEFFSKHGQAIVHLKRINREKIFPMSVIMWQSAYNFHRWYMAETGTLDFTALRFELSNSGSEEQKILLVYDGDVNAFTMVKQCIWDLFWAKFSFNGAPATFRVFIRAFHHPPRGHFVGGPVEVSATATSPVASPRYSATKNEDIDVVDSQARGNATGVAEHVPEQHQPGASQLRHSRRQQIGRLSGPEIIIRLQIERMGRVSEPYDRSVLGARITSRDFFTWFITETGRGGRDMPSSLTFTFKDAMPVPISNTIVQGNEDHFNLMKRDIRTQFDKANNLASGLKEFAIFVTDPNWVEKDPW